MAKGIVLNEKKKIKKTERKQLYLPENPCWSADKVK